MDNNQELLNRLSELWLKASDTDAITLSDVQKELLRLREKCNKQAAMLQHLFPDKFPWTPFITSVGGGIDDNRMPERLYVVPAYGCDFSYVYERTDKTVGPEW